VADDVVSTTRAAILLELKQFRQEMATMGPAAKEAAADMTKGIQRQLAAAEAAARASAPRIGGELGGELDKVGRVAERTLGRMGGLFGDLGDLVFDVIGPLGEVGVGLGAVGAVAGQIVLTAAAVKELGEGAFALADAAAASAERLREVGLYVGPEATAQLDRYAEGTRQLAEAWDEVTVSAGAPVASELGVLTAALADNLDGVVDTAREVNQFGDDLVTRFLPPVALVRDAIRYGESSLYHAFTDTTRATLDQDVALRQLEATYKRFGPELEDGGPAATASTKSSEAAEAERLERERLNATLAESQRIGGMILGEAADHEAAVAAQRAEVIRLRDAWGDASAAAARAQDGMVARLDAATDQIRRNVAEQTKAQTDLLVGYTVQALGSITQIAEADLAAWETRRAAGEEFTRTEAAMANEAVETAAGLAIMEAGVQAALLTISSIASMSALGIPPWISVPAGVGLGALSYGATVQAINARQPAYFTWSGFDGGSGDHRGKDGLGINDDIENPARGKPGAGDGNVPELDHQNGSARSRGPTRTTVAGGITVDVTVRNGLPGRSGRGSI
jgi:hypothetical protein